MAVGFPQCRGSLQGARLWQGADMEGLAVASFGHVNGVHIQTKDTWETYSDAIDRGELPLARAYRPTDDERMRRELVLQLKKRGLEPAHFSRKYGGGIIQGLPAPTGRLGAPGLLAGPAPDPLAP